jgi:hypothetical protein
MTPLRAIRWPRCDGRTRRCGRWWANSVARGSGSDDPPCSVCFGRGATRCASTRSASAGRTRPSATPSSVGSMPGNGTSCTLAGRCSASTPRRRSPSVSSRTWGGRTDAILDACAITTSAAMPTGSPFPTASTMSDAAVDSSCSADRTTPPPSRWRRCGRGGARRGADGARTRDDGSCSPTVAAGTAPATPPGRSNSNASQTTSG